MRRYATRECLDGNWTAFYGGSGKVYSKDQGIVEVFCPQNAAQRCLDARNFAIAVHREATLHIAGADIGSRGFCAVGIEILLHNLLQHAARGQDEVDRVAPRPLAA